MTGEEWSRYVEQLAGEWRAFAQNVMRRVDRLLNRDRSQMLEDIQRVERRADSHTQNIAELREDGRRMSGHIERLEERLFGVEETVRALAEQLARLQRGGGDAP